MNTELHADISRFDAAKNKVEIDPYNNPKMNITSEVIKTGEGECTLVSESSPALRFVSGPVWKIPDNSYNYRGGVLIWNLNGNIFIMKTTDESLPGLIRSLEKSYNLEHQAYSVPLLNHGSDTFKDIQLQATWDGLTAV